jgi:NAD(P)-dependent dehydrogenase (short-subunit alcohol dehydrogenase family)
MNMTESASLRDRVVVITGASAGIGAALARELGRRGASLVLTARRRDKLEEVAASLSVPSLVVGADLTRRDDVARVASRAIDRFGKIDVWVNNAGRGITRTVEQLSDDDVDAMVRDNVKTALYGMQAVVPHFRARRSGHLVNVSSMLARTPWATFRSAYTASKCALNALTECLRLDLAREVPEVRVTCVMPGVVATDFGLNALGGGADSRGFPGVQPVEQVAAIIADAIENGRTGDVYTQPDALDRAIRYVRDQAGAGSP